MDDHRPERTRSNTNTENSRAVSTEVSKYYECLRMLIPICLMTACVGFVLFLAGIVSLIVFDGGEGRAIIAGVGCAVVVISTVFYIVVSTRLGKMNCNLLGSNNRGLNSRIENAFWDTSPLVIVAVKNEDKLCHGEPQPAPERRSPFLNEDVVPVGSRALMRPSSLEQSSLFEDEELLGLATADGFEMPPTYEEATVGMASTSIHGQE